MELAPKTQKRLRNWMLKQVESGEYHEVEWVDRRNGIFKIPWYHLNRITKDMIPIYFKIFVEWARYTGKYKEGDEPNYTEFKTNFRCALNKLPDFEEVKVSEKSNNCRWYKFVNFQVESLNSNVLPDSTVSVETNQFEPVDFLDPEYSPENKQQVVPFSLQQSQESTDDNESCREDGSELFSELINRSSSDDIVASAMFVNNVGPDFEERSVSSSSPANSCSPGESPLKNLAEYNINTTDNIVSSPKMYGRDGKAPYNRPRSSQGACGVKTDGQEESKDLTDLLKEFNNMQSQPPAYQIEITPLNLPAPTMSYATGEVVNLPSDLAHLPWTDLVPALQNNLPMSLGSGGSSFNMVPSGMDNVSEDDRTAVGALAPAPPFATNQTTLHHATATNIAQYVVSTPQAGVSASTVINKGSSFNTQSDTASNMAQSLALHGEMSTARLPQNFLYPSSDYNYGLPGMEIALFYGRTEESRFHPVQEWSVDENGCRIFYGERVFDMSAIDEEMYGPKSVAQLSMPPLDTRRLGEKDVRNMSKILESMSRGLVLTVHKGDIYAKRLCLCRIFTTDTKWCSQVLKRGETEPQKVFDYQNFKRALHDGKKPDSYFILTIGHEGTLKDLKKSPLDKVYIYAYVYHKQAKEALSRLPATTEDAYSSAEPCISDPTMLDKLDQTFRSMTLGGANNALDVSQKQHF